MIPATERDPRIDRLYALLPAIHRMRDAEHGHVLQALLRVIGAQVNLLEDDISRLYQNYFVETAEDWLLPYLGELLGLAPQSGSAALPAAQAGALTRALAPRRELGQTVRWRQRKGSLALLEELARAASWPARAQEFYPTLGWNQHLNFSHPERAQWADLRNMQALEQEGGPFGSLAHTIDVRRMRDPHLRSGMRQGWRQPAALGLFIWRLRSWPVQYCAAYCHEKSGPHCFTFSVLGQDAPLFIKPQAESDTMALADEINLPLQITRRMLARRLHDLYGEGKSLAIYAPGWNDSDGKTPIAPEAIIVADLADWKYTPPQGKIALDPERGRFVFPPSQLPRKGVRVNYNYGLADALGGGAYQRPLIEPAPRMREDGALQTARVYKIGRDQAHKRISEALQAWRQDKPQDAVLELCDNAVYTEPLAFEVPHGNSLQLRAAQGMRPVLRLLDWQTDAPDSFLVVMGAGSRLVLDGLLVTGCSLTVSGPGMLGASSAAAIEGAHAPAHPASMPDSDVEEDESALTSSAAAVKAALDGPPAPQTGICNAQLILRHCTLVPGWGLEQDCSAKRPAEPSLELIKLRAEVRIEHCILGSIQIQADESLQDPLPLCIRDSILDACAPYKEALGALDATPAFCLLDIQRSTVFGICNVHALSLAQDTIFTDCLHVARRQIGCMRYCWIPPGCRTPRRYACQPDLAFAQIDAETDLSAAQQAQRRHSRLLELTPQFVSRRYGRPGYAQLRSAAEIAAGAESGAEMGVFHNLYQPQRRAHLQARLDEYTAAGMQAAIIDMN
ncbi:hypothetical protein V8J88_20255 [Massilia sp. W12]|uniref:hypothetical protein n=1 Tax=Massilia sp. W12 TaxID=3126507 RepID=UPI0030D106DD